MSEGEINKNPMGDSTARVEEKELDQLAKEETEKFKLEREGMKVEGEESLQEEFDKYKLAKVFGLEEEAAERINNIQTLFNERREKMEEGGQWDTYKKELFASIVKNQTVTVGEDNEENTLRYRVIASTLKKKFGEPVALSSDASSSFGRASGSFTRIAGTPYVAHEYKNNDRKFVTITRWSDDQLTKFEGFLNLIKERTEGQ